MLRPPLGGKRPRMVVQVPWCSEHHQPLTTFRLQAARQIVEGDSAQFGTVETVLAGQARVPWPPPADWSRRRLAFSIILGLIVTGMITLLPVAVNRAITPGE